MNIGYELKTIMKEIALSILLCLIIAVIVAGLLRTTLFAGADAFLFRLMLLTAITTVLLICCFALLCTRKKDVAGLGFSSCVLCIGISSLLVALFFSLGPMTIERSYTIYSLADMTDHADQSYTAEEVKRQFINGYIEGANASQKRLDEQVSIGNIDFINGKYRISKKGKRLVDLFRLVEAVYPVPDESSIYPNGK